MRHPIKIWLHLIILIAMLAPSVVTAQNDKTLPFAVDMASFKYDQSGTMRHDIMYKIPPEALTYMDDPKYPELYVLVKINTEFSITDIATSQIVAQDSWVSPAGMLKDQVEAGREPFRLMFWELLQPGEYELELMITDLNADRSGQKVVQFTVPEYPEDELMISDIILATEIQASEEESIYNKNGYMIRANPDGAFTIQAPVLYFYYEIYNIEWNEEQALSNGDSNQLEIKYSVISASGDTVKNYSPRTIKKNGPDGIIVDGKNIVTLKNGTYDLCIQVKDMKSGAVAERKKSFSMSREWVVEANVAEQTVEPMDEKDAVEFLEKVQYFISPEDKSQFEALDGEGKARFAANFWRERDPNPLTPTNEFKTEIERRITYANEFFSSKRAIKSIKRGFETDRGRIYVRYGDPDDRYEELLPNTQTPIIVWRYFNRDDISYAVFADERNLGNYRLIVSDDPREVSDPTLRRQYGEDWDYIMDSLYR